MTESGPKAAVRGVVEDIKGKTKEVAGTVSGKEALTREGRAQQEKARAARKVAEHEARADVARAEAAAHEAEERANRIARERQSTFKPMGPWIETDFDLGAAHTIIRVNGAEMIRFKTDHMLFGPAAFISRMSQYLTLYPGDVVWMGTEGAPENVKHGDVIDIEITGIGTLTNPVRREGM